LSAAAGNDRDTTPSTIRTPGDVPSLITVGAVNIGDKVTNVSSQGPVLWTDAGYNEPPTTKPDITAPGEK